MDEIRHDHLLTGDQCAICEGPVGDDPVTLEGDDGGLLRVCRTCAARRHGTVSPDAAAPEPSAPAPAGPTSYPSYTTPAQALTALREIRERRAAEHGMLAGVAARLEHLAAELIEWQTRATTYEQHARSLEGELKRTRERLLRAEELLATCTTGGPSGGPASTLADRVPPPSASGYPDEAPLTLEEVRLAQRYFNDSAHIEKLGSVRRSLGRPAVSLVRLAGAVPRLLVTAAWEIVWYQYVVDLGADVAEEDRVTLHAEGMELDELLDHYKEANASLDDQGRLDASELEVSLLSGESALITEMSAEEEQALEDATEEIWDRHSSPEFRWDD